MSDEKIHKVLARSGIGSRREMERWIKDGRISVNNQVATLGDRIAEGDVVSVDGTIVNLIFDKQAERRVLVYNKPVGEICTRHDPEGRPTVFDHLPPLKEGRWIAIGRLDINTSGLLLFTTDGELANALMHPSAQIDREYAVRVLGSVDDALLKRLTDGVLLEDGMARFTDVQFFDGEGANKWYHCVVMEGKNREVRRLWESQEVQVSRLKRVRFGPVFLPSDVRAGTWKMMEDKEVKSLSQMLELKPRRGAKMSVVEKQKFDRRYKKQRARRQEGD
ncbi:MULTISPECIES: 23S rRNA pseudouridine(2605) synthase RluB [unclassified Neptuniibacter]|uniref:23S rRNA pseudouridine(2605) synthase RluB n=1 Tax=unclassified Neptuniibacter TaxID=2630693 RepID=UPI0026E1F522|nr:MULTISPECIES: pseudouridine synthase [unclassified Neptuniibacter]MDO6512923.1 pseudouridine synthase [Neptuniibacter sp. 2_MG-2023]MDO6592882.1 pseudouridine synthase [Neptuniibacter sp. 1_MG-2023]